MVLKKKERDKESNSRIDRLLLLIFTVVFVLAITTGVLSFIRLNNIIYSVKSGIRPDKSLLLAKEISSYLTEGENSVKSYSLTRNEEDMLRFYQVMDQTGNKLEELKSIVNPDKKYKGYETDCGQWVKTIPQIKLTCGWVWTSETAANAPAAKVFNFNNIYHYSVRKAHNKGYRALAVRDLE